MSRARVIGIAVVLVGIFCWVGAGAVAITAFSSVASWTSPGTTSVELESGKWMLFEQVPQDQTSAVTPDQVSKERTMTVEQFAVVGPQGQPIALECTYCSPTNATATPLDLKLYNTVASFNAPVSGTYQLTAKTVAATVAVGNPFVKLQSAGLWLMVLPLLGGMLISVGIVLIVRGKTAGSAAPPVLPSSGHVPVAAPTETGSAIDSRPSSVAVGPPGGSVNAEPGWYPNPYLPGTTSQMWWNGKEWTSNWR